MELRKSDYIVGLGFAAVAVLVVALSVHEVGAARSQPVAYERFFGMPVEAVVDQQYRIATLHLVALALPALLFLDRKRRRLWCRLVPGVAAVWFVAFVWYLII